jgi:hypothetical protein
MRPWRPSTKVSCDSLYSMHTGTEVGVGSAGQTYPLRAAIESGERVSVRSLTFETVLSSREMPLMSSRFTALSSVSAQRE